MTDKCTDRVGDKGASDSQTGLLNIVNNTAQLTAVERAISRREVLRTGIIENELIDDHDCVRNYDGSSGAMESDGLLLLLKQLYEKYKQKIFVEIVVTDDDTKIKSTFLTQNTLTEGGLIIEVFYQCTFANQYGLQTPPIVQNV